MKRISSEAYIDLFSWLEVRKNNSAFRKKYKDIHFNWKSLEILENSKGKGIVNLLTGYINSEFAEFYRILSVLQPYSSILNNDCQSQQ